MGIAITGEGASRVMDLYLVVWVMAVLTLLWACFGLPFWLILAAITYFSSKRSRGNFADARDRAGEAAPQVTRYARPAKIAAFITAGTLCLGLITIGVGSILPGRGVVPMGLLSLGGSLLWSVPAMSAALAMLLVVSIFDILRGHRVAGRDSKVAFALATGIQAALLVCVLVAGASGVQML